MSQVKDSKSSDYSSPEWLTLEYLEKVLKKYKKDESLKIVELLIKPATAKGENYASVMTRIHVTLKSDRTNQNVLQQESYIVKTSYKGDSYASSIISHYDVYRTEMEMYEKILPQLTELLHEIGDRDKLFADTIHVDYANSAIIFEDLLPADFTVADRIAGMDMAHAKLALKKLAKMHATASVLEQRYPGMLQHFDHGIFNRHTQEFAPFFRNMFTNCANFARNCAELGEYYAEKLLALRPHLMEYATRVYDLCENNFNTLNHGDFWINNVMLRYCPQAKNGRKAISDIILIDFQFCAWGSPAVDLHYFLNTSLEAQLRLHHQEELVQYYHQQLSNTLKELKYTGKIPTLFEFWQQWEAGRFIAVTSALTSQAIMINDKTEDADFEALMLDDERGRNFRKLLFSNPAVQEYIKHLLPIFDRRGLLDVRD